MAAHWIMDGSWCQAMIVCTSRAFLKQRSCTVTTQTTPIGTTMVRIFSKRILNHHAFLTQAFTDSLSLSVKTPTLLKAMLHEAIFFATCNATNVALQVARTLYFSQRCETSSLRVTSPLQLATQFCQNGPIRAHLSQDVGDLARPSSCLLLYALEVAKKVANV